MYRTESFSSTQCTWRPLVLNCGLCASWIDSSDASSWFGKVLSLLKYNISAFRNCKKQSAEQLWQALKILLAYLTTETRKHRSFWIWTGNWTCSQNISHINCFNFVLFYLSMLNPVLTKFATKALHPTGPWELKELPPDPGSRTLTSHEWSLITPTEKTTWHPQRTRWGFPWPGGTTGATRSALGVQRPGHG